MATNKILENHPLYNLDMDILNNLTATLKCILGKPFRDFCRETALQAEEEQSETRKLGIRLARGSGQEEVCLQEQLLGFCRSEAVFRTFQATKRAATPEQQELFLLFNMVLSERYDLENMAVALETAEKHGTADHAARVREILGLEETLAPAWWSAE